MKWQRLQNKRKWIIIYILFTSIYIIWRLFFTLPTSYGLLSLILGSILLIVEMMGTFDFFLHFIGITKLVVPMKPILNKDCEYPHVDVFIATYNEPEDILYKTIIGCKNMDYPDKDKVHIYILDDGKRGSIKQLCEENSIGYITRDNNEHAKAGNINNALQYTSSPYIVTFDADMIPLHNFLTETIPYFIDNSIKRANEKLNGAREEDMTKPIGFIQTPQAFYNADIFQHRLFSENVIPNEQDYFHRDVQVSRNASNSVIYSGSNTVISRKALEDVGGFVTGIITEDIATGIKVQVNGYQCFATNKILATGLAPYDLEAIIKQRNRWARGCIQTFRKSNPIFIKGLNMLQRLNYFNSLLYWYTPFKQFVFILAPILFTVFGVRLFDASLLEVLLIWLPMFVFNTVTFKKFCGKRRSMKWTNIYDTILMPTLMWAVFLETFGIKMDKFEVTSKKRENKKSTKYKLQLFIPHAILYILTVMGITKSILEIVFHHNADYTINLFWLTINGYSLFMSLLFALERPNEDEKFELDVPILFEYIDNLHMANVVSISEMGITLISDSLYFFNVGGTYPLKIARERYISNVNGRFLNLKRLDSGMYQYSFVYKDLAKEEYEKLILILFDREPEYPNYIMSQSVIKDITRNTIQRYKTIKDENEEST